mgnify:CR=1 FL=1
MPHVACTFRTLYLKFKKTFHSGQGVIGSNHVVAPDHPPFYINSVSMFRVSVRSVLFLHHRLMRPLRLLV